MIYFPIFLDIRRRPILVVGGGEIAARKINMLIRYGAEIRLVAQELCPKLLEIERIKGIIWIDKIFKPEMLSEVFLVIAATDDAELNDKVYKSANKKNIFANIVDDKYKCSFIFPSIVDRSPIMLAISSGGTAPVLVRILREKLESIFPLFIGKMAIIAGTWRDRVKQRINSMLVRRRFWEKIFINNRFTSFFAQGCIDKAEKLLYKVLNKINKEKKYGEVALVGAGPGDSGLLTLRGLQLMQQADVVLYDSLVSTEILDLIRRDAISICVGKRVGKHLISQDKINRLLVTLAKEGKRVVRLKGGDPFIFGRGGEELEELVDADIPFQVVPGITAAVGAAAYAGIPLTHRDYAHSVTFITGHICKNSPIDWKNLAICSQTLVIYMGIIKAEEIGNNLLLHGRTPQTPVAVISCGTCGNQKVLIGNLLKLAELARHAPTPALVVIGEVVALNKKINWFF